MIVQMCHYVSANIRKCVDIFHGNDLMMNHNQGGYYET